MSELKKLQLKASKAFDTYLSKYADNMQCQKGCSNCCYTDLTIMSWEESLIYEWFAKLSPDEKSDLKKRWNNNKNPKSKIVFNQPALPCAFLIDDQCSIYEARPIICRTQGMFVTWTEEKAEIKRSVCPLNFENESNAKKEDDLNLDTLNYMSVMAQKIYDSSHSTQNEKQRTSLAQIKTNLMNS